MRVKIGRILFGVSVLLFAFAVIIGVLDVFLIEGMEASERDLIEEATESSPLGPILAIFALGGLGVALVGSFISRG